MPRVKPYSLLLTQLFKFKKYIIFSVKSFFLNSKIGSPWYWFRCCGRNIGGTVCQWNLSGNSQTFLGGYKYGVASMKAGIRFWLYEIILALWTAESSSDLVIGFCFVFLLEISVYRKIGINPLIFTQTWMVFVNLEISIGILSRVQFFYCNFFKCM